MPNFTILAAMLILVSAAMRCAAAEPTTKPAAYVVTPMRVQEFQGRDTFVYVESETSFADLHPTIDKLIKQINEAINTGKFQPDGTAIFVYKNVTDMSKPFTLQVGMPARPGVKTGGDVKVRKLEPLRAASIVFIGTVDDIPKSYEQLFKDVSAAGLTPTGENREVYAYWEGPESPNNVVLIQIGVK